MKQLTNKQLINYIHRAEAVATSFKYFLNILLIIWSSFELTNEQVYYLELAKTNY